jgi:hypothetical protein
MSGDRREGTGGEGRAENAQEDKCWRAIEQG